MFKEEIDNLLQHNWSVSEKELIERIVSGLLYYKRILPSSFKKDILDALKLCNSLKQQTNELVNSSSIEQFKHPAE